jgi:hypothetical protein
MSRKIKDLREQITVENLKDILALYGVEPAHENEEFLVLPTACHNVEGGSHKLYYYKDNHMFKCYTECDSVFDIFTLIQKMQELRDDPVSLPQAIKIAGMDADIDMSDIDVNARNDMDYIYDLNHTVSNELYDPEVLNESAIMQAFVFSPQALKIWEEEGISLPTMIKYKIKYDPIVNAIIIPHYNDESGLIGVRGRYLNPDAYAKYKPINFNGKVLTHKTSRVLYGLNFNKEAIKKHKIAIIFEGEKSVMKMDTVYGENSVAVAVSGKTITIDHIKLLLKYGVEKIVLAFDRDYSDLDEIVEKQQEYRDIVSYVQNFCNVSMIIDYGFKLEYKDSPIDKGKEVFEELMSKKINL